MLPSNESQETFTVTNGCIRFGLAAMKNVGKGAMQSIIEVRKADGPFTSLQDFCARVDLTHVNKRMMENLIKGGAFDSLEGNTRISFRPLYQNAVSFLIQFVISSSSQTIHIDSIAFLRMTLSVHSFSILSQISSSIGLYSSIFSL